ncbi:hypothetical protein P9112_004824 [Eukaryota sp. TZLM1-RC]
MLPLLRPLSTPELCYVFHRIGLTHLLKISNVSSRERFIVIDCFAKRRRLTLSPREVRYLQRWGKLPELFSFYNLIELIIPPDMNIVCKDWKRFNHQLPPHICIKGAPCSISDEYSHRSHSLLLTFETMSNSYKEKVLTECNMEIIVSTRFLQEYHLQNLTSLFSSQSSRHLEALQVHCVPDNHGFNDIINAVSTYSVQRLVLSGAELDFTIIENYGLFKKGCLRQLVLERPSTRISTIKTEISLELASSICKRNTSIEQLPTVEIRSFHLNLSSMKSLTQLTLIFKNVPYSPAFEGLKGLTKLRSLECYHHAPLIPLGVEQVVITSNDFGECLAEMPQSIHYLTLQRDKIGARLLIRQLVEKIHELIYLSHIFLFFLIIDVNIQEISIEHRCEKVVVFNFCECSCGSKLGNSAVKCGCECILKQQFPCAVFNC